MPTYRVYKGEEYYGRNINYTGTRVLCCNSCGYLGTYSTIADLDNAKKEHDLIHERRVIELKVIMIGTPFCSKCKRIAPVLEEYCSSHSIEYNYQDLATASVDILSLLKSKSIKQAPVFLIYRKDYDFPLIVSGDDIFLELESRI